MTFSSLPFLLLFLPSVVIAYFAVGITGRLLSRQKGDEQAIASNPLLPLQNFVLLIASLFFYAWGEPIYVVLLIGASVVAWASGCLMKWLKQRNKGKLELLVMIVTIVLLILSLCVFKYLGFFIGNLNRVPFIQLPVVNFSLPIGISFYTFQILSYIIDLHLGRIGLQRNPLRLMLYVSLFPQLIAGPIVRYQTIESELGSRHSSIKDIKEGTYRFIIGLSKKVLIADNVALLSDAIYNIYRNSLSADPTVYDCVGTSALWLASMAYTMQIYYDFSGYSDMAIGLGRIFGFHFPENFNHPYVSHSVSEFWRRWHISLSSWFRDYVYFPLGGSRCSKIRRTMNIMVVWMLTGLWHGASWNFVLWGVFFGIILMIEKAFFDYTSKKNFNSILGWAYCFIIVNTSWVLFHIENFSFLHKVFHRMFCWSSTDWTRLMAENSDIVQTVGLLPIAFILSLPTLNKLWTSKNRYVVLLRDLAAVVAFLLCFVYIISSSFHPFIYFRF